MGPQEEDPLEDSEDKTDEKGRQEPKDAEGWEAVKLVPEPCAQPAVSQSLNTRDGEFEKI